MLTHTVGIVDQLLFLHHFLLFWTWAHYIWLPSLYLVGVSSILVSDQSWRLTVLLVRHGSMLVETMTLHEPRAEVKEAKYLNVSFKDLRFWQKFSDTCGDWQFGYGSGILSPLGSVGVNPGNFGNEPLQRRIILYDAWGGSKPRRNTKPGLN